MNIFGAVPLITKPRHLFIYAQYALPVLVRLYSRALWGIRLRLIPDWRESSIWELFGFASILYLCQGHWKEAAALALQPIFLTAFIPQLGLRDMTHATRAYGLVAGFAMLISAFPLLAWICIPLWIMQAVHMSEFYQSERTFFKRVYRDYWIQNPDDHLFQNFFSDYREPAKKAYVRLLRQEAVQLWQSGERDESQRIQDKIRALDPEGKIL